MKTEAPAYFEPIRQRAERRWEQLEADPELAAPWHQLFQQVQSPRHVVSELLQNADDACATEASVRIEDGAFIFEHNGEDFREEHFASLCRFGYSNKRALHTIGFRGIGFKSTFSLGKRVELYSSTLSVAFDQTRFTQPIWLDPHRGKEGLTTVRVEIENSNRRKEVETNLGEWLASPVSLLFFKSIRRIEIDGEVVHWGSFGPGPVPGTEWLTLNENVERPFLMARSGPEPFPAEALAEIKQARMLGSEEEAEFPPCAVDIVLGATGRLFVVLPTGVKTTLPFACNAPFIQDPARLKIKDPETSPTNRWLLERAGRLAGDVMLRWIQQEAESAEERASAYNLMPDVYRADTSLEGTCGTIVEIAFAEVIEDESILLTDEGRLAAHHQGIIVPEEILDVWPNSQAAALLDDEGRPALSRFITDGNREKLLSWQLVEAIDDSDVLGALDYKHLPRPESWRRLFNLWTYLAPLVSSYRYRSQYDELCIVPVQGKDVLCSAREVARLGEKRLLASDEDWTFLGDWLSVVNQNWLRYLTEQRRKAETSNDQDLGDRVDAAYAVLKAIGLHEPSDASKVIDQVAGEFFRQEDLCVDDCVRIAQIAAKLGATIGDHFEFVCQDGYRRRVSSTILFDSDGSLESLLPEEWCEQHLHHPDYQKAFTSCTRDEWEGWVSGGRSGLKAFVPLEEKGSHFWSTRSASDELKKRGYVGAFEPRYRNPSFRLQDWDFPQHIWKHWEGLAEEDISVWGKVAERILVGPQQFWSGSLSASLSEQASNGSSRRVVREGLAPLWILKLREKPCLHDTHGFYKKPVELLRRTPDTEALMDVEPFIHGLLDNETTRPLLKLLGIGDVPTGPERILGRLRALAKTKDPPIYEVEKWYRRLDQMFGGCSTEDAKTIIGAFAGEKLVLTDRGSWDNSSGVFVYADEEDAPGADAVRTSVRELTLWRKIGVAERPTAERAINWLMTLSSGEPLTPEDARRARALLARYPQRVWEDCGHWLNLAGEWTPVEEFDYALTMQTLVAWSHLHQWVKQKTADLQKLLSETTEAPPFSALPPLAAHIEERFHRKTPTAGAGEQRAWLHRLGIELTRLKLDDAKETERIRNLAAALARSRWQITRDLEVVSYIDDKPAGTPRRVEAIWVDDTLYAEDRPMAKLARAVSQELGKAFRRSDIADAIKLCFERPAAFVTEYMEENFTLVSREEAPGASGAPTKPDDAAPSPQDTDATAQTATLASPPEVELKASQRDQAEADTDNSAQDDDKDEADVSEAEEPEWPADEPPKPRPKPKPPKPSIMERLALRQGFHKDQDSRFFDDHGNWIGRANGSLFPWELRSAAGEIQRHYWPKEHCLEREPLQLEAEIWSAVEQHPDTYVLVLSDPEGEPVEVTGSRLRAMREQGDLTLHPSTYRLVYGYDHQI